MVSLMQFVGVEGRSAEVGSQLCCSLSVVVGGEGIVVFVESRHNQGTKPL
jgi:hypothetical protein